MSWFLNLKYVYQPVVHSDLFAISLASSLSTIHFFQFLINPRGFISLVVFLMGACSFVTEISNFTCVKCNVWLLIITHHSSKINNIGITTTLIVCPPIHNIRPSLWNFGFPRYGYYIVITTSDGSGYCLQAHFCSISKDVINTCWWFHFCAVCNYPGRLTDNLNQVAGTGYSLKCFLEWEGWWESVNI